VVVPAQGLAILHNDPALPPWATPGLYEGVGVNGQEYDCIKTSDSELDLP
jgi:hypothetical protein